MIKLYNLIIYTFLFAIKIHSLVNKKSKKWIDGRKNVFSSLENKLSKEKKIIWFHCASLGEYEQAKELIKNFKNHFSKYKILLTFFSPSGYNNIKKNKNVDWIFYLPIDTKYNATRFIETVNPTIAFFLKSEFWYNYMNELHRKNIPLFHVSSIFDKKDFNITFSFSKKILANSSHFFVQDLKSKKILNNLKFHNVTVTGDSRFDSITANIKLNKQFEKIKNYCEEKPTIIFSSIWKEDEHIYIKFIKRNKKYNYIIVPHEINYCNLISKKLDVQLYSDFKITQNNKTLVIDEIGVLKDIYKYCKIAYIGGGFGKGIHNLIEASANDIPVVFGPNHTKFKEGDELIQINAGLSIKNYTEFCSSIEILEKSFDLVATKNYINHNSGATKKIINFFIQKESEFLPS